MFKQIILPIIADGRQIKSSRTTKEQMFLLLLMELK